MNYSVDDLISASKKGNVNLVKEIIGSGLDINSQDNLFFTALHEAAEMGHKDLFWYLISQGAEITIKTDCNFSILHAASIGSDRKIIEYLLAHGLDINEITTGDDELTGWSALHCSVLTENIDAAETLIERGIYDLKTPDGLTALYLAEKMGKEKIFLFLKSVKCYGHF